MGSSKKQTVGYKYFMGLHFGVCQGPVDALLRIMVGDRVAWLGEQTANGTIAVDAPKLFGGEEREGGVDGQLDVMMGGEAQTANAYLTSVQGALQPAYRGLLSAVFRRGLVSANNPYLKPWAFTVRRILAGWYGGSAWYPEKAAVQIQDAGFLQAVQINFPTLQQGQANYPEPGTAYPLFVTVGPFSQDARVVVGNMAGVGSLIVDDYLLVNGAAFNASAPAASSIAAGTVLGTIEAGRAMSIGVLNTQNIYCGASGIVSVFAYGLQSMNPAHIVYQCLTDPEWGMGYSPTIINDASFRAAADIFHAEGMGLCLHWTQQQTIDAFVQAVMDHAGAVLRQNPRTGLFEIKALRGDYVVGSLPLLDESNIRSLESFDRAGPAEAVNEVTVRFDDAETGKTGSVTLQNLAAVEAVGGPVARSVAYPGLPTPALAARVAMRDLRVLSTPLARVRLRMNRQGYSILPGDVVRLAWPKLGISQLVLRVARVNTGALTDGAIEIEAVEDVFGLGASVYVAQQPVAWQPPDTAPTPIATRAVIEAPYYELQRQLSSADLSVLAADAGYLLVGAARPSGSAVRFTIADRTAGVGEYEEAGAGDFCAAGTLAASLGYAETSVVLSASSDPGLIETGTYALIGPEIVRVDGWDPGTSTLTIGRGVLDTVAASHAAGATILFLGAVNASDGVERVGGEAVDVKLLTVAGSGTLGEGLASADTVTFASRAARPYPPGRLRINGLAYPVSVEAPVHISWAHRNRLQQNLEGDESGSIGPEGGTTYSVRLLAAVSEVETASASGISGTSWTVTPAPGAGDYIVEVWSASSSLQSIQRHRVPLSILSSPVDPFFANVSLLLRFEGANGSSTFTDSGPLSKTVSASGAVISTAQFKFGSASGFFDGVDDSLLISNIAGLSMQGADFCVEGWARLNVTSGGRTLVDFRGTGLSNSSWEIFVDASSRWLGVYNGPSNSLAAITAANALPPANGQFFHWAVTRSGATLRLFVNGVLGASATFNPPATNASGVRIGVNQAGGNRFSGHMDELRITLGQARYTANFAPPTQPFPDGAVTISGKGLVAAASLIPGFAYVPVTLLQPASGPTAGNIQTIFYDWTGWPSGDAAFNPAKPITFNFVIRKRGATEGAPDAASFTASVSYTAFQSITPDGVDQAIAFTGPNSVNTLGAASGVSAHSRTGGPPYPSGWCQDFTTAIPKWQFALAFPQGERVWVRNPAGSPVAGFSEWEIYGFTTPGDPGGGRPFFEATVALDLSPGENFVVATPVGQPQAILITLPPGAPTVGATYTATLAGTPFSYVAAPGDTANGVATALAALIDASPTYTAVPGSSGGVLRVDGQPNTTYTYDFTIT
jgi:hypothetical protein